VLQFFDVHPPHPPEDEFCLLPLPLVLKLNDETNFFVSDELHLGHLPGIVVELTIVSNSMPQLLQ
jgi:hypothetical protein